MGIARKLEADVGKLLSTGKVDDLRKTDAELSQVFELDSRSQTAAILWLRNRVLPSALLLPGEPRGIESALARCKTLEIDEAKTAFGKVTSFLAEGDLAGAAANLPKWDEKAKSDAYFTSSPPPARLLERAGDVRAIGRYKQAIRPRSRSCDRAACFMPSSSRWSFLSRRGLRETRRRRGRCEAWRHPGHARPDGTPLGDGSCVERPAGIVADRRGRSLEAADSVARSSVHRRWADRRARRKNARMRWRRWIKGLTVWRRRRRWRRASARSWRSSSATRRSLGKRPLRALRRTLAVYRTRARSLAARVACCSAVTSTKRRRPFKSSTRRVRKSAVVRAVAAYESLDPSELDVGATTPAMGGSRRAPLRRALCGEPAASCDGPQISGARPQLEQMAHSRRVPLGRPHRGGRGARHGQPRARGEDRLRAWGDRGYDPDVHALRLSRLLRHAGTRPTTPLSVFGGRASSLWRRAYRRRVLVERFYWLASGAEAVRASLARATYSGSIPAVLGPLDGSSSRSLLTDVADAKAACAPRRSSRASSRRPPTPPSSTTSSPLKGLVDARRSPRQAARRRQTAPSQCAETPGRREARRAIGAGNHLAP